MLLLNDAVMPLRLVCLQLQLSKVLDSRAVLGSQAGPLTSQGLPIQHLQLGQRLGYS